MSCYSYLHYHKQWSMTISKGANLDCGSLLFYSVTSTEGLSNINHAFYFQYFVVQGSNIYLSCKKLTEVGYFLQIKLCSFIKK